MRSIEGDGFVSDLGRQNQQKGGRTAGIKITLLRGGGKKKRRRPLKKESAMNTKARR